MSDNGVVIALGYFDSVHVGHRKVIEKGVNLSKQLNCKPVVFTFDGNLRSAIGKGDEKFVYTTSERKIIFQEMGVRDVFYAPVTKEFLGLSHGEFLQYVNQVFNVKGYVCGKDFRFGKGGEGNVDYLSEYAKSKGQRLEIADILMAGEKKVSTSLIKELLSSGDVANANKLLGKNYFITGNVFEDRKVGSKIGFPTVNIKIDKDKQCLKNGVYHGAILISGEWKRAVINYGARPTFDLNDKLIEAHVIDFNGDLYGENLTVRFDGFLREIQKFVSVEQLKNQLEKDVEKVKNL